MADSIRDFATTLAAKSRQGRDISAVSYASGTINAVNDGPPVTVDVYVNGNGVLVPGVAVADNFTPRAGLVAILAQSDSQYMVLGHLSESTSGWVTPTLGSGFSHDGNSNGNVQYRRVLDNGAWKVQWQGGAGVSGSPATVLNTPLVAAYRPVKKRSIPVARNIQGGSPMTAQIDFNTDGTVSLIVALTVGNSSSPGTDNVDPNDSTTTDSGHFHGVVGGHSHTVNSHTHSVDWPQWVSFNGLEYFL